jgi:cytochrome P450
MMVRALGNVLLRNPYPLYALLRRTRPLVHDKRRGLWMLFDYESVKRALTDHEAFGSDLSAAGFGNLGWFIFTDPPRHVRLRALVSQAFTPRTVAGLEPRIRELAPQLLDEPLRRRGMDLVNEFAVPLPLMVIAGLLGVPATEWNAFRRWGNDILGLISALQGGAAALAAGEAYSRAHDDMVSYLTPLVRERRQIASDDLLTRLVVAEVEGERLLEDEILAFFELLLLAGHETATNLIANAVPALLAHPQEMERLRSSPQLLVLAVEEVLRYRSPVQAMFRVTRREVVIHGQVIPKGKLVVVTKKHRRHKNTFRFLVFLVPLCGYSP